MTNYEIIEKLITLIYNRNNQFNTDGGKILILF